MGPKCYSVQCIVNGEENPKIAPSPWDFATTPEENRATARQRARKFGRDRAYRVWFGRYARGQTHGQTHTHVTHTHTHTHTHRRAHYNTSPPLPRAK